MLWEIPVDAGFLCGKAAMFIREVKEIPSITPTLRSPNCFLIRFHMKIKKKKVVLHEKLQNSSTIMIFI
jgi:hypothetical protein